MIVLDSSAFIALVNREAGWEIVEPHSDRMILSAVNFCESVVALANKGMPMPAIQAVVDALIEQVIPFDTVQAKLAAELRQQTRAQGLSLGDRACIALGMQRNLPIYTADKIWSQCGLAADICVIR